MNGVDDLLERADTAAREAAEKRAEEQANMDRAAVEQFIVALRRAFEVDVLEDDIEHVDYLLSAASRYTTRMPTVTLRPGVIVRHRVGQSGIGRQLEVRRPDAEGDTAEWWRRVESLVGLHHALENRDPVPVSPPPVDHAAALMEALDGLGLIDYLADALGVKR